MVNTKVQAASAAVSKGKGVAPKKQALEQDDVALSESDGTVNTDKSGKKRGRRTVEINKYFFESNKKIEELKAKLYSDKGSLSSKEKQ